MNLQDNRGASYKTSECGTTLVPINYLCPLGNEADAMTNFTYSFMKQVISTLLEAPYHLPIKRLIEN